MLITKIDPFGSHFSFLVDFTLRPLNNGFWNKNLEPSKKFEFKLPLSGQNGTPFAFFRLNGSSNKIDLKFITFNHSNFIIMLEYFLTGYHLMILDQ